MHTQRRYTSNSGDGELHDESTLHIFKERLSKHALESFGGKIAQSQVEIKSNQERKTDKKIFAHWVWENSRQDFVIELYRCFLFLVPGTGGSQLEAKLNKPSVLHWYCDRQTSDYFTLWLKKTSLLPYAINCWVDNMRYDLSPDINVHILLTFIFSRNTSSSSENLDKHQVSFISLMIWFPLFSN